MTHAHTSDSSHHPANPYYIGRRRARVSHEDRSGALAPGITATRDRFAPQRKRLYIVRFVVSFNVIRISLHYRGFIVESYGAFGNEAWDFIHKVAKRDTVGESSGGFNPWGRPEWKRHFTLSIGFAIQRGNAAMLIRSDQRRRANTNFRASGPSTIYR